MHSPDILNFANISVSVFNNDSPMKTTHSLVLALMTSSLLAGITCTAQAETATPKVFEQQQKQWVGQPAPQFKLQDQNQQWHELKQYRGKWLVLYFYPKDNSPGCTQEANQFKTLYPEFKKNHAEVLGISLDDVASHQKFSQKLGLPFAILADNQHQLANQFGLVKNLGFTKIAKRESFLIDPQGTVVYHYSSVNTQSHAAEVLKDIQRLSK